MATIEFDTIVNEILKNKKFNYIKNEAHHGITRMEHSMHVATYVYKYCLKMNLDYVSATRAAILHDFFINEDFGNNRGFIQGIIHPEIAVSNAREQFEINEIEANAIESHMFPLCMTMPKYKESWVISFVDKGVAIYECLSYKFNCAKLTSKLKYNLNFLAIFIFYLITMGEK